MAVFVRLLIAGSCLAIASLPLAQYRSFVREKTQLRTILEETGVALRRPSAWPSLEREPDLERARLLVARLLLADASDTRQRGDSSLEMSSLEEQVAALSLARQLALEALGRRPAAWQGFMIVGATRYLEWSLTQDRRLVTEWQLWEDPLTRAVNLAPNQAEPKVFLATAYLEVWPMLSPAKRHETQGLMRQAFREEPTLPHLLRPWLDLAASPEQAFEILPQQSIEVWPQVQRILAAQGKWEYYQESRQRWKRAVLTNLERWLKEADLRLAGGDLVGARRLLLRVVNHTVADHEHAPYLIEAFGKLPPGPVSAQQSIKLRGWLEWGIEQCLLAECRLPPATVTRLAHAVPDLEPAMAAQSALAAGDLALAEQYERRDGALWSEDWAPFLIMKTRHLLERNEVTAARRGLSQVHRLWQDRPIFRLAQARLAHHTSDESLLGQATAALHVASREEWPPTAWRRFRSRQRLEMMVASHASGLLIDLARIPPTGGVVEIRMDGGVVVCSPVSPGTVSLAVEHEITARLHVLELASVAGGEVMPGAVRLVE